MPTWLHSLYLFICLIQIQKHGQFRDVYRIYRNLTPRINMNRIVRYQKIPTPNILSYTGYVKKQTLVSILTIISCFLCTGSVIKKQQKCPLKTYFLFIQALTPRLFICHWVKTYLNPYEAEKTMHSLAWHMVLLTHGIWSFKHFLSLNTFLRRCFGSWRRRLDQCSPSNSLRVFE